MNHLSPFEGIPMARLSAKEIPLEHQFEVWKQTTSPMFDVIPTQNTQSCSCSITSYLVEQLTFMQSSFDEMQFTRTSRHLSHQKSDCITLQYFCSGGIQGTLKDGKKLQVASDVISIQDFAHPFSSIGQANSCLSVLIPRQAIAIHEQIYNRYPMFSWPVNSPAGQLLTQTWITIWENLPITAQADAPAIAQGFIGLLNGVLNGLLNGQSTRQSPMAAGQAGHIVGHTAAGNFMGNLATGNMTTQAQVALAKAEAMKAYLRDNLHLPNVSVNSLCRVFHCSRATVYRLFKAEGGVHTYVRKQRLTRCYQELRELPPDSPITISEIATKWGFTEAASFSRLFRKQYGISPSEVEAERTQRLHPLDKDASYWCESDRLRQWLENYS
ncbi:MAG: helix-turn-helix transcriptional regulator [Phormidesmis sp.]